MECFKGEVRKHPVIILVDNDSGAKQIKIKYVKDEVGPFYHYGLNLYVTFTPLGPGGEDSAIEDLFDEKTLSHKLDGKTFSKKKKIDPKIEFGKTVFATKVVSANQTKIKFDGFKCLLDQFSQVIGHYTGEKEGGCKEGCCSMTQKRNWKR